MACVLHPFEKEHNSSTRPSISPCFESFFCVCLLWGERMLDRFANLLAQCFWLHTADEGEFGAASFYADFVCAFLGGGPGLAQ